MAEENNNQPQPPEAPQPPKQPSPNRTAGPNGQPPVSRTTVISIILALMVAFFVGSQFMSFGQQQNMQTDALLTSEFVQAVDQGRVTKVVYAASDYTVSGTYYPAATAGAAAADAFNGAFDSLNARIATFKDADGSRLGGVATETLSPVQLGNLHNFTSTYVGSDSLGELMAAHPEIQYEIQLPNPFLAVLTSILPILIIGALLFFFFINMH